ncbi:hypothetical protein [Candidatus Accumulibacter sp. ACC012]|uniref:hypothetical protein n=1 Tax=Candidatus Accumulibacter sp. ACC012 TaxID=2823332 RepID=UPI0025C5D32B|nr:hypothetical protein [Candidatus Accumulibacter sp. ACC012]
MSSTSISRKRIPPTPSVSPPSGGARQGGSEVIVGVNQLLDQGPAVIPELLKAVSAWGLLCVGGRLGYASVAPIAAVKLAAR